MLKLLSIAIEINILHHTYTHTPILLPNKKNEKKLHQFYELLKSIAIFLESFRRFQVFFGIDEHF